MLIRDWEDSGLKRAELDEWSVMYLVRLGAERYYRQPSEVMPSRLGVRTHMPDLRLSVVLCTYNGAAYLQQQLASLLSQSRRPDEIVIGDDGSTDTSWAMLQAFAEEAGTLGIHVYLTRHAVNLGYVENFSAMLQHATGDLVFLCDQDDIWRADKLDVMTNCFLQDPSLVLLHSDARLVDEGGSSLQHGLFEHLELSEAERQRVRDGAAFDVNLRRNIVTGATAAMRRVVVEKALPVGKGWVHDAWLGIIASALGRVDFLDAPLIDYRQHDNNQIGIRKRTWKMRLDDMLRPRAKLISEKADLLGVLLDHLRTIEPLPQCQIDRVRDMRAHFLLRQQINGRRISRVVPICHEYTNGRYGLYGTGVRGAFRDFLRRD